MYKKFNNKWKIRAGGWTHKSHLLLLKRLLLQLCAREHENCNCKLYICSFGIHDICSVVHRTNPHQTDAADILLYISRLIPFLCLGQPVSKTNGTAENQNWQKRKWGKKKQQRTSKATTKSHYKHTYRAQKQHWMEVHIPCVYAVSVNFSIEQITIQRTEYYFSACAFRMCQQTQNIFLALSFALSTNIFARPNCCVSCSFWVERFASLPIVSLYLFEWHTFNIEISAFSFGTFMKYG